MVEMVVERIEEAFASRNSVPSSSESSTPSGRNLGTLLIKEEKEI
ncbi:unnamed protein product, partial [Schistosoma mattheei]